MIQQILQTMRAHEPTDFIGKGVIGILGSVMASVPSWVQDAHAIALFVGSALGAVVAFLSVIGLAWGLIDKWKSRKTKTQKNHEN